ncbi:hypothetical protein BT69DRAFT_244939 [Atractiella rhizophila]|nr:hypothetical protein BT69DRAFT_244939 [Atractiella rhizophila]
MDFHARVQSVHAALATVAVLTQHRSLMFNSNVIMCLAERLQGIVAWVHQGLEDTQLHRFTRYVPFFSPVRNGRECYHCFVKHHRIVYAHLHCSLAKRSDRYCARSTVH